MLPLSRPQRHRLYAQFSAEECDEKTACGPKHQGPERAREAEAKDGCRSAEEAYHEDGLASDLI